MQGLISSPFASLRYDAFALSLLVDNVQHHLEGGTRSSRFLSLHALADTTTSSKAIALGAGKLCDEIRAAWAALQLLPIEQLAISSKTRSLSTPVEQPIKLRETALYQSLAGPLPFDMASMKLLGEAFEPLVTALVRVTAEAPRKGRLVAQAVAHGR